MKSWTFNNKNVFYFDIFKKFGTTPTFSHISFFFYNVFFIFFPFSKKKWEGIILNRCVTVYSVKPFMCHFSQNVTYIDLCSMIIMLHICNKTMLQHDVTFSNVTTQCNTRNVMALCNLTDCWSDCQYRIVPYLALLLLKMDAVSKKSKASQSNGTLLTQKNNGTCLDISFYYIVWLCRLYQNNQIRYNQHIYINVISVLPKSPERALDISSSIMDMDHWTGWALTGLTGSCKIKYRKIQEISLI